MMDHELHSRLETSAIFGSNIQFFAANGHLNSLLSRKPAPKSEPFSSEGYKRGEALKLSKRVFVIEKSVVEQELGYEISEREYRELQGRIILVGSHLIEAVRTSPLMGCNGSYELAAMYYEKWHRNLRIHEFLHSVVAIDLRKSTTPLFMKTESQFGDKNLLIEEAYTILLWGFPKLVLHHQTFEAAYSRFFEVYEDELVRILTPRARDESLDVNTTINRMRQQWREIRDQPGKKFIALAREIYDGAHRGDMTVALRHVLTVSKGVKSAA